MHNAERRHNAFETDGWQAMVRAEIGRVRERMEDAWAVDLDATLDGRPAVLTAVFDGLGGLPNGDEAARAAADGVLDGLEETGLRGLLADLNERVAATGGGTTAVIAVFPRDVAPDETAEGWLLSVGDSTAYTLSDRNEVNRRTERDSVSRHVLSDYLGRHAMEGHLTPVRLAPGATLVLCTDGVDEVVGHENLAPLFQADREAVGRSIDTVFDKVRIRGAPDNATLIVLCREGRN